MLIEVDAVFESGVLRPLEPLALSENQQVRLTVNDQSLAIPAMASQHQEAAFDPLRREELQWLATQAALYAGQWVAISGSQLVASGADLASVQQAAKSAGVQRPLLTHVPPANEEPFGGW